MPTTGSLYFHVPFCSRKCPYCHFYVLPDQEELQRKYFIALEQEWRLVSPRFEGMEIVSVYFGGGTPSLLKPSAIRQILSWIPGRSLDCEITLEANPDHVSLPLMQAFAEAGINRVSLGVQSLDEELLKLLGREHGGQKAVQAIEHTYQAGIQNITIDLMYDIPRQTLMSWRTTLQALKSLPIAHLSLYNLTFEPQTVFFKKQKELIPLTPDPDLSLQLLQEAVTSLEEVGLHRYEISAFARTGYASRHNLGYWTARPFWGLGPSAFSYWEGKRFRNVADLKKYAQALEQGRSPVDFEEKLPYPQNLHELLAVQLRLLEGVDLADFERRHGALPTSTQEVIFQLQKKGWIEKKGSKIKLSSQGLLFYDFVAEGLI